MNPALLFLLAIFLLIGGVAFIDFVTEIPDDGEDVDE